ncbi:MAG: hypothetical protein GOP50_12565 [Candidatus Heimdallarchaeota archaeon]|nr:hypothetical protein [Candidatus Heimdallarchaeota archaeon]
MKNIKQITFNFTQSRRIKNYARKNNIPEKEVLSKYPEVIHIIFQAWKKNYSQSQDVEFRDFFLQVMKFAEFEHRLKERKSDLIKIKDHLIILEDALVEYDRDYNTIIEIEQIVKDLTGG